MDKLLAAGIRDFFSCGGFGDHFELRTAISDHAASTAKSRFGASGSVCFFGDTPYDIQAARNVNANVESAALALEPAILGDRFQVVPRFGTWNKNAAANLRSHAHGSARNSNNPVNLQKGTAEGFGCGGLQPSELFSVPFRLELIRLAA